MNKDATIAAKAAFPAFEGLIIFEAAARGVDLGTRRTRSLAAVDTLGLQTDPRMTSNAYYRWLVEQKDYKAQHDRVGAVFREVNRLRHLQHMPALVKGAQGVQGQITRELVRLDLEFFSSYSRQLCAAAQGAVHSAAIVNAALVAAGEPALQIAADGRSLGLVAAAARLGLDNATAYMRGLAAGAQGVVDSAAIVNAALVAAGEPALVADAAGRFKGLTEAALRMGLTGATVYLRRQLTGLILGRKLRVELLVQAAADLERDGLEPMPSEAAIQVIIQGVRVRCVEVVPALRPVVLTAFAATRERGLTRDDGTLAVEAIRQANYPWWKLTFVYGALGAHAFLRQYAFVAHEVFSTNNPAAEYFIEYRIQLWLIESGLFPYLRPGGSPPRMRMFRNAGVGNSNATLAILGARLGVYIMLTRGPMPPLQDVAAAVGGAKRSRSEAEEGEEEQGAWDMES